MIRQVAFLMFASKGALSHEQIMKLTWRQFGVYLDSFTWLLNEQSDKGKGQNSRNDLIALKDEPRAKERKKKMVEETKAKLAKFNDKWGGKEGQIVKKTTL